MLRQRHKEIEWLEFDLLNNIPSIHHGVYLRHGGTSRGAYQSLNTSYYVGDEKDRVQDNLLRIRNQLQLAVPQSHHLVYSKANHGKLIKLIETHTPSEIEDYDGIATSTPGISLMMEHADCQIGLFYDPKNHAAANVHAGWRGSVQNIFGAAVNFMRQTFGSRPADLLVCISPSLGPEKAEFIHYRSELPEEFWPFQVRPNYFDFWSITEFQLQSAGVLPHHIEVARLCTYSNPYDFFSYRRDRITGRHSTIFTLL